MKSKFSLFRDIVSLMIFFAALILWFVAWKQPVSAQETPTGSIWPFPFPWPPPPGPG